MSLKNLAAKIAQNTENAEIKYVGKLEEAKRKINVEQLLNAQLRAEQYGVAYLNHAVWVAGLDEAGLTIFNESRALLESVGKSPS